MKATCTPARGFLTSLQSDPLPAYDFFSSRPVQIEISDSPLTSDAGLLPIRQFDEQVRFTEQFAASLEDKRDPKYVTQPLLTMVRQRIFGIIALQADRLSDHRFLANFFR